MPISFKIGMKRACVVRRLNDDVSILTELPSPFRPDVDPDTLWIRFQLRRGAAEKYLSDNFPGLQYEVIEI